MTTLYWTLYKHFAAAWQSIL